MEALIIYAKIQHANKEFDTAVQSYEKVLSLDPKQKNIYLLLGSIYLEQKKNSEALRVYKQLVHNFRGSYAGHFFIGKIYFDKKQFGQAERAFNKTLELESDLLEPRFELLKIYKNRADNSKILQTYQEILKIHPESISAAIGLGYYYYSSGKKNKASEIFENLGDRSLTGSDVLAKLV